MSNIDFKDMLYFDDEQSNITSASQLGVVSFLVTNGMCLRTMYKGLDHYDTTRRRTQ